MLVFVKVDLLSSALNPNRLEQLKAGLTHLNRVVHSERRDRVAVRNRYW